MKINPINNFQFNRKQKAQAKNNPIFEGVRFVPDRALAEKYLSNSGQLTSISLKKIAAKFKNISDYVNKKILPMVLAKKIMPYVNNNTVFPDNVKNEDLAKILWPEDTDVKINCEIEETFYPRTSTTIKFFDCINGNNPLIEMTLLGSHSFRNDISRLKDILTIFEGALLKNDHEFDIYSDRLEDWISKFRGLEENFSSNRLENLLSTLIEQQPEFKNFIKQLEETRKNETQQSIEEIVKALKTYDENNINSKSLSETKSAYLPPEGSALKIWLGDEYENYICSEINELITRIKDNKISEGTLDYLISKLIREEQGSLIDSFPLFKEAKERLANVGLKAKADILIDIINYHS